MQYALISSIVASIVAGVMGVIIIHKKLVMLSGGIAHTSYGGVGLGYLLGFEPILGAFAFAVGAALGIGVVRRKGARTDAAIALFWSLGMALGILFIALMPGYPPNIGSYLFGSILSVTTSNLILMSLLSLIVVALVFFFFNDWKAYLFDAEFAAIRGLKTNLMEYILLLMVALTSVALIRVAGIILTLALLTAPAASAEKLTRSFGRQIALSVIIALICTVGGLALSYELNIASGASIVILSVTAYFIALTINGIKSRAKNGR
jgi:zinc transport system permease protein